VLADASCQVPASTLLPPEAAASQSVGSVISARTVPASAVPQFAGTVPERMRKMGAVPMVLSIWSSQALRTVVEYWKAILRSLFVRQLYINQ
jgi:hypothetical protein